MGTGAFDASRCRMCDCVLSDRPEVRSAVPADWFPFTDDTFVDTRYSSTVGRSGSCLFIVWRTISGYGLLRSSLVCSDHPSTQPVRRRVSLSFLRRSSLACSGHPKHTARSSTCQSRLTISSVNPAMVGPY